MSKNSFGQSVAIFLVIIGILYVIGIIGEAGEPKCIKAGCNNKRASDSNYCYLHESSGSRYSSYGSSTYDSKYSDSSSAGDQESTNRTQRRTALKTALMILMMMDMTISTWTAITIMTDMTAIVIMRMEWMMRWTRLGRIGKDAFKSEKDKQSKKV